MHALVMTVLWGALLSLWYAYVGYPLLLAVWSWLRPKPWTRAAITPSVTVVVAAWDEAPCLKARIINLLEQNYPSDKLDVVVVSDGSSDDTEAVVNQFDPARVTLVKLEVRQGKAVALNHGVAVARGDLIVFADARQLFSPTAVACLISNFADGRVGAVSGELMLEASGESNVCAVGTYWAIEKWIRKKQALVDSVVGSTGAIYAARRELFEPLPPATILDDLLIPMRIAMKGYRVVFDPRARAVDHASSDYRVEFKRKVRTLAGNYQAIHLVPDLLKPNRNRLFLHFVSHKLFRLAAPAAMVLLLAANAAHLEGWYVTLFALQILGYGLALVGWGLSYCGIRERLTSTAFAFCLLNVAAFVGAIRFYIGSGSLWTRQQISRSS